MKIDISDSGLAKFIVDDLDERANWIEFTLEQTYHKITFQNYSILKIEPFERDMCTAHFVAECESRDCLHTCEPIDKDTCLNCDEWRRYLEMYIDGFYVQDGDYVAYLQTGVRVPVPKEILQHIEKFEQRMKKLKKGDN